MTKNEAIEILSSGQEISDELRALIVKALEQPYDHDSIFEGSYEESWYSSSC